MKGKVNAKESYGYLIAKKGNQMRLQRVQQSKVNLTKGNPP